MTLTDRDAAAIEEQVLHGITLNRTPGLHFLGNFLDLSFDQVSADGSRLRLCIGPHCADPDGQVNVGALALLTDFAMSASVRAALARETRLGTVNMHIQFTGLPWIGPLEARGLCDGFQPEGAGKLGVTHAEIRGPNGLIARASGSFMQLDPPPGRVLAPVPHRRQGGDSGPRLAADQLSTDESAILRHAESAMAAERRHPGRGFASRFFGFSVRPDERGAIGRMRNGDHIGNRVGHVQGGISFGFAVDCARAALGGQWRLSNVSAAYISPGRGDVLRARSRILHRGGLTAVVRTQVVGAQRRMVLDVLSSHLRCADAETHDYL